MSAVISTEEWLHRIAVDYLEGLVADGGAAVKFAVPLDPASRTRLVNGLPEIARSSDYVVAQIDSAITKIHMIDQLWYSVASQLPFGQLADRVLGQLARHESWQTPTHFDERPIREQIASANGLDVDYVKMALERQIQAKVFKQRNLAKDFRIAMTWLCRARLNGGDQGAESFDIITSWLCGRNRQIAPVKPYMIFSPLNRSNARYMLESAFSWVRLAGYRGTALLLDIGRLTDTARPADGSVAYSKGALLDAYEVLRQFIDSIDELDGVLMVVMPDEPFLDFDDRGRGIMAYQALFFRVYDEVRDRELVNPMASLVRLAQGE
jgi:hypothetical protein